MNQPLPQIPIQTLRSVATALNLPADPVDQETLERFAALVEIDDIERLRGVLRDGVPYKALNAKLHEQEAQIVAQAGRPGAVTIATNMAGRGTDILLGGNPDSLAAHYLEEHGVQRNDIKALARLLVERDEAAARAQAERSHMETVLVDELKRVRLEYDQALAQFEANPALYFLNRYVPGDADTFAERWQFVNDVLAGEYGMARALIAATPGLHEEQIATIAAARADLEAYRQDRAEFLANQLFDRIYAARARLIAAVLHNELDRAAAIVRETPTMDESLIGGIQEIKRQVERDAESVRERGGMHIIGTERHEARRIDNQLRGRAGRQGDPGSSRFFISLEDELMKRFGPSIERVKGIMARAGFEDDLPLEFGIISRQIEGAQTKVEGYNFDMRKRVVEYDDVMNKQREVIYSRRRAILEQGEEQRRIGLLVQRYLATYADWATGQVEELTAAGSDEAEVTAQLDRVLPGAGNLDRDALRNAGEAERQAMLDPLIAAAQAERYPLRLLLQEVGEFVEFDQDEAFTQLHEADRPAIERYLDEHWRAGTEGDVEQRIKDLFLDELQAMQERYVDGYESWMLNEIARAVDAATTHATNIVNAESALRRLAPKLPGVETINPQQFVTLGPEVLRRQLETLIRPSREAGNHLRLLARDLVQILPFIPNVSPQQFLEQFRENLAAVLQALPEEERQALVTDLLAPVDQALAPVFAGIDFTPEQGEQFNQALEEAWIGALDQAIAAGEGALDEGLEVLLNATFDRWRNIIGVDLLNRYGREIMLNAIDREWVDYLTAMEELRQGIGLQGLAQRDPLVAYKTQAFTMFEELLGTIDTTTVRQFFGHLPNWVMQVQAQQMYGQAVRAREIRVGPNEPCPCGSGKKFKKCHGAPGGVTTAASTPVIGKANGDTKPKLTQQQRAPAGEPQRRKSKGRSVPGRR